MRVRNAFVAFAGSYFLLVGIKNGSLNKLIDDSARFLKDASRGAKTLTRIG